MNSDKDLVDVKMKMMMGIKVPMRDGVELTTDIYLPEDNMIILHIPILAK